MRAIALLFALFALAACGGPADNFDYTTCGVRPRVVLPVTMTNNVPLIAASIKGKPATFILDTGSVSIVLTENALLRLGLQTDASNMLSGRGIGGESTFFSGKLHDLTIGDLPVPDHDVRVLPEDSPIARQKTIDGLFGVSVLSVFEVDLDLPHKTVTLNAGRLCPTTVDPPWLGAYSTIPAQVAIGGRFIIPVTLDGHQLNALIDTGAARSVLADDVAATLGVTAAQLQGDPHATLAGVGPNTPAAYLHRFHTIQVGKDVFPGPYLLVSGRPEPGIDMILGEDYLATHHLWLSAARKSVFVEAPLLAPMP